ncbi:ABC transporter permease [Herbaspirillum sp. RTI4]|uniref:ABC transporter permease n=1 Tax=Herbaspirillum sp. RTI4 TaxID=3048640 RepID=UPI002AB3A3A4|nr:ABC transporter permease [Herbaspirillum sp. RTI4]MDY7577151.1 ABC transporter permease [Herbaspirillum sp. RTI4]MEA9980441.1 ABC transporter permease [Herbaspirillum sp. RTI4]
MPILSVQPELNLAAPLIGNKAAEIKKPTLVSNYWRRWKFPSISIFSVALFGVIWQLSGTLSWVDPLLLPPPSDILATANDLISSGYRQTPLWEHLLISTGRALAAFVAAILSGIPLGLGIGLSPTLAAVLNPFVQFLRPLPKIALIPLVIVWFGIGEGAKFFLIFISCFLSIVVGAAAAVLSVSQARLRAAQTLGATPFQQFAYVVFPNALPELFTSVRLSIGIGWTSLIAAEMVAATSGLGWMVINAGSYLRTDIVLLGIVLLGLTGYFFDWILVKLQKRFVPWTGKDA